MTQEEWFNTDGLNVTVVKDPNVEVSDEELRRAFSNNAELNVLTDWVNSITPAQAAMDPERRTGARRSGGLFERDRYVNPIGIFSQFKVAKDAAMNDDVVSNVLESTEALVFNKVRVECGDDDEENIWDQILADMELDIRLREMWRDLFVFSQYYVSSYWEKRTYRVEGMRLSRPARKSYEVHTPTSLSLLDPMKVLPVGDFLFGRDKLAFIANPGLESESIENVIAGKNTSDLVIREMITGPYSPTPTEEGFLSDLTGGRGVGRNNLFELNPQRVWRHTATRPTYERFAPVRLSSVFELLDLKHQLRQMDRAHLLGATNFIVLVRKGSDAQPATSGELANLSTSVRTVARTPLIVGDHRLSVDIVTPTMDATLDPKRYNNIDSRITARLYQIFHLGGFSAGAAGDDSLKLARVIARGLESRRTAIARNFEKHVLLPVWRENASLTHRPKLVFTPRQVALDFDPNFMNLMRDLFMHGDVSRETMLGILDIEQEDEARRREIEKRDYDETFPAREQSQGDKGRLRGGNRNGGGENPDSRVPNPVDRRPDADVPEDERRTSRPPE